MGYNVPGIYPIPCKCGEAYIGQIGRTVQPDARNINAIYDSTKQKNLQ